MEYRKYAFGIDIGGTTCKIGFFETSGVLLDKWEIHTNTENAGKGILRDVACAVIAKMAQANITEGEIEGIGVGVPGPVTVNRIVHGCENLGWETVDVAGELEAILHLPVKVENDANMAVLGEMYQGGGSGSRNLILVTLGTGVGSGIVCGGRVITGHDGAAGEIGHMVVNTEETLQCSCGKYGCLEQYASATGIVRVARDKFGMTSLRDAGSNGENKKIGLTAREIFDRAKDGDSVALEVVEHISRILGIALANVACVTNPEVIVIGGGVSKAGEILTRTVQKYFVPNAFGECSRARFAPAELGNDAGIWGCLKLLIQ